MGNTDIEWIYSFCDSLSSSLNVRQSNQKQSYIYTGDQNLEIRNQLEPSKEIDSQFKH